MAWNEGDRPKIAICVPHTGNVSFEWSHKMWGPLVYTNTTWCEKKPFGCRGPPIDVARESLVKEALEWGADYIFFVDSDVITEYPENVNKALYDMWKRNVPIVSGMYRTRKVGSPWAMWKFVDGDQGFENIKEWTGELLEVDVVGLGCCLIHKSVFNKVSKPWFRWDIKEAPSEDFYFLMKARAKGIKVIVDTKIKCSHLIQLKVMPGVIPAYSPPQI